MPEVNPPSATAAPVTVHCPQCRTPFSAPVTAVVDAADERARAALLSGHINVVTCPACNATNRMAAPLLYVDQTQEIAYVWVPDALGLTRDEQEQAIGQLSNEYVETLPPEQRRMYLLQPRTFFSEQSFYEAVLEANGITADDIQRAQETSILVEELSRITDDDALRARLREAGREDDAELVTFSAALAQDAAARGDDARASALAALHDRLVSVVGPPTVTFDDVLAGLLAASDDGQLESAVAAYRPALDYSFFAELTHQCDATEIDELQRERLRTLRTDLLTAIDTLDERIAAEAERAVRKLEALMSSPDPGRILREQPETVDEAFLFVAESNWRVATERGDRRAAEQLALILNTSVEILEADLPPRPRLMNQLARASDSAARAALLDANPDLVDESLAYALERSAEGARASGAEPLAEALDEAAREVRLRIGTSSVATP